MEDIKGKIHESMLKFHGKFSGIKGDKKKAFKGEYHELATLISEVRPILFECDLYFTQRPILINEHEYMQTTIRHKDGSFISDDGIRLDATDKSKDSVMQSVGASQTYAKRYGLMAILGLAEDISEDLDNPDNNKKVVKKSGIDLTYGSKFGAKYPEQFEHLKHSAENHVPSKFRNNVIKTVKALGDDWEKTNPDIHTDLTKFYKANFKQSNE